MKKIVLSLLAGFFISIISISCSFSIDECKDEAISYLEENFPDDQFEYYGMNTESIFNSLDKIKYFYYTSKNLNKLVTVQVIPHRESINSQRISLKSNYLAVCYEEEEKEFYKKYLDNYFSKCIININNSQRFHSDYREYFIWNEATQDWDKETKTYDFEYYMNYVLNQDFQNCIDFEVVYTQKKYLTQKDFIDNLLLDFTHDSLFFNFDISMWDSIGDGGELKNENFYANIKVSKKDGYTRYYYYYREIGKD